MRFFRLPTGSLKTKYYYYVLNYKTYIYIVRHNWRSVNKNFIYNSNIIYNGLELAYINLFRKSIVIYMRISVKKNFKKVKIKGGIINEE